MVGLFAIEPVWLSSLFGPYIGERGLTLHLDPDSGVTLPDLTPGDTVRATGSADSEAATWCVAKTHPDGVEMTPQRKAAQLYCRAQFVVTEVVVTP